MFTRLVVWLYLIMRNYIQYLSDYEKLDISFLIHDMNLTKPDHVYSSGCLPAFNSEELNSLFI